MRSGRHIFDRPLGEQTWIISPDPMIFMYNLLPWYSTTRSEDPPLDKIELPVFSRPFRRWTAMFFFVAGYHRGSRSFPARKKKQPAFSYYAFNKTARGRFYGPGTIFPAVHCLQWQYSDSLFILGLAPHATCRRKAYCMSMVHHLTPGHDCSPKVHHVIKPARSGISFPRLSFI